eukprot:11353207-Alexandrium_andersonii.AAC.1
MAPGHAKRRPSVGLEPGLALPRPEEASGAPGSLLVHLATDDVAPQDVGRRPEAEGIDPPPLSADSNQ